VRLTLGAAALVLAASAVAATTSAAIATPARLRGGGQHLVVKRTIPVGPDPIAIEADPLTNEIYATNLDSVSVISGRKSKVIATIPVGVNLQSLAVNTATDRIYVPDADPGRLFVISGRTNTITAAIKLHLPTAVAVDPVADRIYVTSDNFAKPGAVFVLNGRTNKVIATIRVGHVPRGVTVNPVTHRIYVINFFSSTMSVINGRSDKVVATVPLASFPTFVAADPSADRVYVSVNGGISVFSGRTNKLIATINIGVSGITPDSRAGRIWLSMGSSIGQVAVISSSTYKVISMVRVGAVTSQVAVNSLTGRGYATNTGSNTVSVLRWRGGKPKS